MENIFHRVSIRKFSNQPVEKEKIEQILRAAMQAPSACNQQPWEFYVVEDKEMIHTFTSCFLAKSINNPLVTSKDGNKKASLPKTIRKKTEQIPPIKAG